MKKFSVALGLAFCLMNVSVFADTIKLPDLTISETSSDYDKINLDGVDTWLHVHYTLNCKLKTNGIKMSLRVNQFLSAFGRAEIKFNGQTIKQEGRLNATLSLPEANADVNLVIHDILYNGSYLQADKIIFYNDGTGVGYGKLYVTDCTLIEEAGSPAKVKHQHDLPPIPSVLTPPANTNIPSTADTTSPSSTPTADTTIPSTTPAADTTNPA